MSSKAKPSILRGIDVRDAPESEMRDLRGREISMIFQNPRAALNPIRKVGHQIEDVLLQHVQAQPSDKKQKAIEALKRVRIARPEGALSCLSVRTLRRHVPARGHCAGAGLSTTTADRR